MNKCFICGKCAKLSILINNQIKYCCDNAFCQEEVSELIESPNNSPDTYHLWCSDNK